MTHPSELLAAFVAGTLPASRTDGVTRHVAECPDCAAEVAAWRRVAGAVGDRVAAVAVPPPGLLDTVLSRLPARGSPATSAGEQSARRGVPRYAGVIGAAAQARVVRILAHQRRLIDRRVWPVAGLVLALGSGFAASAPSDITGDVLALLVPLVAALGVAVACGTGNDPAAELVAASPTGVRAVLLARLTLVLGAILGAASVASLGLAWFGGGGPVGLFAAWLGPMALLSALSFTLSVLWRPAVGIGVAMALWVLRLLVDAGSLDETVGQLIEPLWRTSTPVLLLAALLMAGTVVLLPHLPAVRQPAYGR